MNPIEVRDAAAEPPAWWEAGLRHVWRPYTQERLAPPPLAVERSEGVYLHLADGRRLVDGVSSWWTACHGYNHPRIRAAVEAQLRQMPHVMLGGLLHEPASRLAERLAAITPGSLEKVFFSDSGSVAVEVALKIAVQVQLRRGKPHRHRFVSFRHGYHGDTFACMSVCDPDEGMHSLFSRVLPPQHVVPLPAGEAEFAALALLLGQEEAGVAAVILEPLLQGAGGMRFHEPWQVKRLSELCAAHGVLLILDEIATGFGRTGTLFACEQAGVVPDLLCLSKALTGGTLPLAATLATAEVYAHFVSDDPNHALMHGPTFMGNPLACAAALASLDLFAEEPRLAQVARIGAQLREELKSCAQIPGVRDVRVRGALGVVELEQGARALPWLRGRFVDEGVWVRPLGDVVYLMPPFIIEPNELATLTRAVGVVVRAWSAAR